MWWFEYVRTLGKVWPRKSAKVYLKHPYNKPVFERKLDEDEVNMSLDELVTRYPPPEIKVDQEA